LNADALPGEWAMGNFYIGLDYVEKMAELNTTALLQLMPFARDLL